MAERRSLRKAALAESRRQLILDAAREVFATEGLEGASLRAIAAEAGYTPAALYFHFASKEAIYAELLGASLAALQAFVESKAAKVETDEERFEAAVMAFYVYYARNPRELDLGFYLFRGGMKPAGLSRDTDRALNKALAAALEPISDAARELGASSWDAEALVVGIFAHATGLLLLLHTGRIKMFKAEPEALMRAYVGESLRGLKCG